MDQWSSITQWKNLKRLQLPFSINCTGSHRRQRKKTRQTCRYLYFGGRNIGHMKTSTEHRSNNFTVGQCGVLPEYDVDVADTIPILCSRYRNFTHYPYGNAGREIGSRRTFRSFYATYNIVV